MSVKYSDVIKLSRNKIVNRDIPKVISSQKQNIFIASNFNKSNTNK